MESPAAPQAGGESERARPQEDAVRIAKMALDMVEVAATIPVSLVDESFGNIHIRVGNHSGPVVASVVGDLRYTAALSLSAGGHGGKAVHHSAPQQRTAVHHNGNGRVACLGGLGGRALSCH